MTPPAEPYPVRKAEVVLMLKITALAGKGVEGDMSREVTQYFDLSGNPVFKIDPVLEIEERDEA